MTEGAICFGVYINIQEGEVANYLSLHGELDVLHAADVVQEVIQFFWYMGPDHEYIINVLGSAEELVGCSVECSFFHEEVGHHK
jgi:hypothetical protein